MDRHLFPAAGKYSVTIDTATIPKGLTLRNIGAPTLPRRRGSRQAPCVCDLPAGAAVSQAGHTTPHTSAFDQLAGLTLDGIELGVIIAMGAVGLSLIFGVTGLVNFAQGELVTFGGLAAWWLSTWGSGPGLPLVLAGILAVAAGAALGFSLELGLFRPLRRRRTGNVSLIVVTIGLSLVLSNLFLIMVGGHPLQYAEYVSQTQVGPGPFRSRPRTGSSSAWGS